MAVYQFDRACFHYPFKFPGPSSAGRERAACGHTGCAADSAHAFVHSLIRQLVCFSVVLSQCVVDGEPLHLRDQFLGAAVKFLQRRVLHFVNAFDLPYQEFGIAYDLEGFVSVLDGILERRNQTLIFREVVGLVTQVLAESGNLFSGFILNNDAVAGGAGIATCSAIAMGNQIVFGAR